MIPHGVSLPKVTLCGERIKGTKQHYKAPENIHTRSLEIQRGGGVKCQRFSSKESMKVNWNFFQGRVRISFSGLTHYLQLPSEALNWQLGFYKNKLSIAKFKT